jgi:hypothetical protein
MWNPPESMPYQKTTRVEVRVARSAELDEELRTGLRGHGTPRLEDLATSPFMGVHLQGDGFRIDALSEPDQPVEESGYAMWEFDVRPTSRGILTLQLCVSLRIPIEGRPDERRSVPVLERSVSVEVTTPVLIRRFMVANWQWICTSVVGLGGAIAAWKGLS